MTGFVYFIRCGDFVKIGFSKDPGGRLRALLPGSPHDMQLLAAHPGTERDEAALHRALAKHRHKWEWFRSCAEIDDLVRNGIPQSDYVARDSALARAIEAAGTSHELSRRLGLTPQALSQWERVPPLRVLDVERATGVPRHHLRPDVYPAPELTA